MKPCLLPILLACLLCLHAGFATAQVEPNRITPPSKEMSPAQLQADFDLVRKALEEAHPGLYRYSTKPEMERSFDNQRAKLNRPMEKTAFLNIVAETLATIRCGHTNVKPDDETQAAMTAARKFPFRILIEGKRLMVVLNETPADQSIQPGMEILEINGRKAEEILAGIWPLVPTDGDIETHKRAEVGHFADYYWQVFGDPGEFTVKAADAAGATVTAKFAGVTDADRKANHNSVNSAMLAGMGKVFWSHENLSLRFLNDPAIAEISIRRFLGNDYPNWIEKTFKTLSEKGTQTLVIDLRQCHGGDDMYCAMLVSYLTDKPFHFYDRINVRTVTPSFNEYLDFHLSPERVASFQKDAKSDPSGGYLLTPALHQGLAEQSPGKFPFLGKVFVLISGESFSGAADFAAITHHLKRATFIGEETGGAYFGNNSGMMPTLTLPNSKFQIRLPMYEYWNAVGQDGDKGRGTIPDYAVEFKTADLLKGVDKPLDLAVKLAGTSPREK